MVYFITPAAKPFVLPTYTAEYTDSRGRHAGDAGFIPPGTFGPGLPEWGYTEQYRDENGRKPGQPGFIPHRVPHCFSIVLTQTPACSTFHTSFLHNSSGYAEMVAIEFACPHSSHAYWPILNSTKQKFQKVFVLQFIKHHVIDWVCFASS